MRVILTQIALPILGSCKKKHELPCADESPSPTGSHATLSGAGPTAENAPPPPHPLSRRAREFGALQKPRELSELIELVEEQNPRTALEIGTAFGGTLYCWCRLASPDAVVISVDLPGGRWGGGYTQERAEEMRKLFPGPGQQLHLLTADSHEQSTLQTVQALLGGEQLDFLFIDGDHSYEGAKRDLEMYGALVRTGGIIAFHDILPHPNQPGCQVDEVWREVKGRYRHMEITAGVRTWGGIGVLWQE
jgi:predicted O-methyltransferase YrrM